MLNVDVGTVLAIRQARESSIVFAADEVATVVERIAQTAKLDTEALRFVTGRVRDDLTRRGDELARELQGAPSGQLAWTALRRVNRGTRLVLIRHFALMQGALVRAMSSAFAAGVASDEYLAELGRACRVPWTSVA